MALMGYWTLTTTANGATRIWNSSEEGYYTWNGKKKSCKNINLTISCIIDKELSSDGYKETATHELGHALGWFGHDKVMSDSVMFPTAKSVYTLTARDKVHLQQVYKK